MKNKQSAKIKNSPRHAASLIPPAQAAHRGADQQLAERKATEARKRAEAERKALEDRVAELQARLGVVEDIRAADAVAVPQRKGRVLSTDKRAACAVAAFSDWHVEERVDSAKVNGLNEFNPQIAAVRARRAFEGVSWLIREQQSLFTIKRLVLGLLGDIISGYIHEELLESNYMSPTHAVVFAKGLIADGIRLLLKDDPDLEILVVCKCGNHGRTTPKLRIATAVENSYEWLLYQMLASEFSSEPRVSWQIDGGHHSVTSVFGLRVHTHHGDSVRSAGGIGGITVPLNRAAIQWREKYDADLSIVGHFHQYLPGTRLMVNGSLVGYGAYSDWLPSAAPEPAQQIFFLVDSKRGITQQAPIWCAE